MSIILLSLCIGLSLVDSIFLSIMRVSYQEKIPQFVSINYGKFQIIAPVSYHVEAENGSF